MANDVGGSELTWELLAKGDIILGGRDGKEWTVIDSEGTKVTISREDKVHVIDWAKLPNPKVTLIARADEVRERAEALLQVRLGAAVVARQLIENGPHLTPATFIDAGSLLAHLYLFHQTEEKPSYPSGPIGRIMEAHAVMHRHPLPVDHHHITDFYLGQKI